MPGMHWKTALCSLSIGTSAAPLARAASTSNGPATTSDSLFAISTRLPERAAASVDGRPAAPTMAAMTASTSPLEAMSTSASLPAWTRVGTPAALSPAASFAALRGSCITATGGRCVTHCSSRRS